MQPTLDQRFATHCAPALAGVVPANLISLRRSEFPHLDQALRNYRRAFAHRGVCFASLCSCTNRELILVYRPQLMAQALDRAGVEEMLAPLGYDLTRPMEEILAHLGRRVRQDGGFPHEIGIFLGYPVEDVAGFIAHNGQNFKVCGAWKVYGDVESAQRCFSRMQLVSRKVLQRLDAGHTLFQVFAVA